MVNNASISTTSVDTDPANNSDDASTLIGAFTNLHTTITCPPTTNLDADLTCTVSHGNNTSLLATGDTVYAVLDRNVTFLGTT